MAYVNVNGRWSLGSYLEKIQLFYVNYVNQNGKLPKFGLSIHF